MATIIICESTFHSLTLPLATFLIRKSHTLKKKIFFPQVTHPPQCLKKKIKGIKNKDHKVWIHKNTMTDENRNEDRNLDPSLGIHNCMSFVGPSP